MNILDVIILLCLIPAIIQGIRKGFIILNINGEIVNNPNDIERIYNTIQNSSNRDKVMFITGMYSNGRSAYYAIDIANN